jgi:hypothetical protein
VARTDRSMPTPPPVDRDLLAEFGEPAAQTGETEPATTAPVDADAATSPERPVRRPRKSALDIMTEENRRPRGGRPALPAEESRTERLNVYVTKADSARYKAAYHDMPYRDRPESFSVFVTEALEQRVRALEAANNGGRPYEGDGAKMPPGRRPKRTPK